MKVPGPDHPITITANPKRIVITVGGKVVADSTRTLTLVEACIPPVHYIPRSDVDMNALRRTDHTTYCPYKGDCSYFSISESGPAGANAVWSYEAPYLAVDKIKDHLAFYPSKVDSIVES